MEQKLFGMEVPRLSVNVNARVLTLEIQLLAAKYVQQAHSFGRTMALIFVCHVQLSISIEILLLGALRHLIVCAYLGTQDQRHQTLSIYLYQTWHDQNQTHVLYVLQARTKASWEALRALRVLLVKLPCLEALQRAIVVTSLSATSGTRGPTTVFAQLALLANTRP